MLYTLVCQGLELNKKVILAGLTSFGPVFILWSLGIKDLFPFVVPFVFYLIHWWPISHRLSSIAHRLSAISYELSALWCVSVANAIKTVWYFTGLIKPI
jgi:hypothetical protein